MALPPKFSQSAAWVGLRAFVSRPALVKRSKSLNVPGSFLPVTLEQLARERGVLFSDKSTLCVGKPSEDAAPTIQSYKRAIKSRDNIQCVVRPFGKDMTTTSFALYTFSIAVIVQALCLVSFSSFADHGGYLSATS